VDNSRLASAGGLPWGCWLARTWLDIEQYGHRQHDPKDSLFRKSHVQNPIKQAIYINSATHTFNRSFFIVNKGSIGSSFFL
jgi:hypothetical protein